MAADVLFSELSARDNKKIGLITLNAEKALNALNQSMIDLLLSQLSYWRDNDDIVALFMQGSGEKAFCAGGDVRALRQAVIDGKPEVPAHFFATEYRVDYMIHAYPKPVICWGNGIVMGGGIGLMAGADFRIVTDTSMLAMPEISIGLYPDVAGSWILNHLPAGLGLFMALTGCRLNAADAIYVDLANRFIDHAFRDNVLESLQQADWNTSEAHTVVYRVIQKYREKSAGWLPYSKVREHRDLIAGLMDQPSLAGVISALATLETEDDWLLAARKTALNGSPLSAAIGYRQLQEARYMSLKEVFQSELALSVNTVLNGDFCEGVRSLLVEKDKNPQWKYKAVDQIDEQTLNQLFSSPWPENPLHDL
ncbi:enoyl-CoA hydratase/isomerase family protein [Endozoicomonas sp. SCSIO W0465]|uniref:enoyl-CoA hydratase/isomerase family protein n=1 Tax=Endozoicomonas sp. SCSIO W0465 TaxID=2918516 RepID=UPI002076632A|nr:enoyl-CoA hydratase/isomerase family protein [Endozoicomonas sp. SCSIO W0465]USE34227.1 enoyl-CoA hydratase/isomerase family protein [Endozoicomonas sp. SCSIO W0465]